MTSHSSLRNIDNGIDLYDKLKSCLTEAIQDRSILCSLPGEVRLMILEQLLDLRNYPLSDSMTVRVSTNLKAPLDARILRSCQQMYREGYDILVGRHVVLLRDMHTRRFLLPSGLESVQIEAYANPRFDLKHPWIVDLRIPIILFQLVYVELLLGSSRLPDSFTAHYIKWLNLVSKQARLILLLIACRNRISRRLDPVGRSRSEVDYLLKRLRYKSVTIMLVTDVLSVLDSGLTDTPNIVQWGHTTWRLTVASNEEN